MRRPRGRKKTSAFWKWAHSTATIQEGMGPCFRKVAYSTHELAEIVRAKCERERPATKLYIYECPICKKFHLTKQAQHKDRPNDAPKET